MNSVGENIKTIASVAFLSLAICAHSQTIFYAGDPDNSFAFRCQMNGANSDVLKIYDDFEIQSQSEISGFFGNFTDFSTQHASKMFWEIRTGVSVGNGGTLVAGGYSSPASATLASGTTGYLYECQIPSLILNPGTYTFGIAVDGGNDNIYLDSAFGFHSVGGPQNNGNIFFDGNTAFHGVYNFEDTLDVLNGNPASFSMGVRGIVVPEPTAILILTLGLSALALAKKRQI